MKDQKKQFSEIYDLYTDSCDRCWHWIVATPFLERFIKKEMKPMPGRLKIAIAFQGE